MPSSLHQPQLDGSDAERYFFKVKVISYVVLSYI